MIMSSWLSSLKSRLRRVRRAGRFHSSVGRTGSTHSLSRELHLARQAELLETRTLLSTLTNGNEFHAGAGDVLTVDLSDIPAVAGASSFALTGFSVPAAAETLTQTPHGSLPNTFDLHAAGEVAGRLFLSETLDGMPFVTTGRLAFAPSITDSLTFDADGNAHGFQGTIQIDFTADINGVATPATAQLVVGPDFSTRTTSAVSGSDQVGLDGSTENQLRLEQRLAFLGFPDTEGHIPLIDGQPDGFTDSSLRLFQSVVDPNGTVLPIDPASVGLNTNTFSQAGGTRNGLTAAWLNQPDAPAWKQLVDPNPQDPMALGLFNLTTIPDSFEFLPLPNMGDGLRDGRTPATGTFASSWVADAVKAAADQLEMSNMANPGLVITRLSNSDGESSADSRDATIPGRLHTAGMEVDIDVPLSARTGNSMGLDAPAEAFLAAFMAELNAQAANFGPAGGIRIAQVVTSNSDLVTHLNTVVFGTLMTPGTVATTTGARPETLHIEFIAPTLPTSLTSEQRNGFDALGQALAMFGADLATFGALATPLPLLGPATPNGALPTLGAILDPNTLFQTEIATPISSYFAGTSMPTLDGLRSALATALQNPSFPTNAVTIVTDTHNRAELHVTYSSKKTVSRPLDLGQKVVDAGLLLNSTPMVNVDATLTFEVTLGVDLANGLTPPQAAFVKVQKLDVTGSANLSGLNVGARVGFIGANISSGSFSLGANIGHSVMNGAELKLGTLLGSPLSSLVTTTDQMGMPQLTGTVMASLPVSANIGVTNLSTLVTIGDTNIFDAQPVLFSATNGGGTALAKLDLPPALVAFTRTNAGNVNGALLDLREFFNAVQQSPLLDAKLPFTTGAKLGQVFDFAGAFDTAVSSLIEVDAMNPLKPNAPKVAAYSTAQGLDTLVPAITGVSYNPTDVAHNGNPVLRYTINASRQFTPLMGKLDLSLVGDNTPGLGNIVTTSDVNLTRDVTVTFTVGIELVEPGATSTVNASTPLNQVVDAARWNKLRVDPPNLPADVVVTLRSGQTFSVKLNNLNATDTNNTLQTIIGLFNTAATGAGLSGTFASFDLLGKRFQFTDPTSPSGPDPQFRLSTASGSLIGMLLGLVGKDEDKDGVLFSGPLHGDTVAKHVFVESPLLKGKSTLAAPDIDATATFGGLIGLNIQNGLGTITADATLSFNDPTPASALTLADLVGEMTQLGKGSTLVSVAPMAAANLSLPVTVATNLSSIGNQTLTQPGASIGVSWPTVFKMDNSLVKDLRTGLLVPRNDVVPDLAALKITQHNFGKLAEFDGLNGDDVESLLGSLAGFVDQLTGFSFFDTEIPLINRSLKDLLGFGSSFRSTVQSFTAKADHGLDKLEADLIAALSPQFAMLDLSLDLSGPEPVLKFDLPFDTPNFTKTLPLGFDLDQLGIPGLSALVDFKTDGQLTVNADVQINVHAGIELSQNGPRAFLYDTTSAAATLSIGANNVQFEASLGPFGVKIGKTGDLGSVVLDADGAGPSTAPASFTVGLTDNNGDGRHYFDENIVTDLTATLTGAAQATLPVFTTSGTQLDPLQKNLLVTIADIGDPVGTFSPTAPDFAGVLNNLNFGNGIDGLIEGLDALLTLLEQVMDGSVFGADLPFVGDQFKDQFRCISDLRNEVIDNLRKAGSGAILAVRQAVFDALGPGNLDWLNDITGDKSVTLDDVILRAYGANDPTGVIVTDPLAQINSNTDSVQFEMNIGSEPLNTLVPFDFDLGIPGLGLDVDAKIMATFRFGFDLKFGVSKTDGVYFDVGGANELKVDFEVEIVDLTASANLGFLQIDINTMTRAELDDPNDAYLDDNPNTPQVENPTESEIARSQVRVGPANNEEVIEAINGFKGAFRVDIADPNVKGGRSRLGLDELGSIGIGSGINPQLGAVASLHLNLLATLGGQTALPSIGSELHLYWGFDDVTEFDGTLPTIEFRDARLNLGEFISDMAGGVLGTINDILDPVRPVVDGLTTPIPILSDLAGSPVTAVDLIRLSGFGGETLPKFIEAVKTISDLAKLAGVNSQLFLPLGGFRVIFDPNNSPHICLDDVARNFSLGSALGSLAGQSNTQGILDFFDAAPQTPGTNPKTKDSACPVSAPLHADHGSFTITQPPVSEAQNGSMEGMFDFPILRDPFSVFELLLGLREDVNLLTYDMPPLEAQYEFSLIIPLPIFPPAQLRFTGGVGYAIDFAFGYDTQGLVDFVNSGDFVDIFNGFYVSDDPKNAAGLQPGTPDSPELSVFGFVEAAAQLSLGVASVGAEGGIFATIGLDLNDPNNDGKVRIPEILDNLSLGPQFVFDLSGKVEAYFNAFVSVLGLSKEFELARITLFDFEIPRPTPTIEPGPTVASLSSGVLTVNVGPRSDIRKNGSNPNMDDGIDDVVSVRLGRNPNQIIVSAAGTTTTFGSQAAPVTSIVIDAGGGNDTITIDRDIELPVMILGGAGNDVISAGDGDTQIDGGDGNDKITSFDGNDVITGGDGDDVIVSGGGNDLIMAGIGNDKVDAGAGKDTAQGEAGNDMLVGGLGDDQLDGGGDDDQLFGDRGDDLLTGGDGIDVIAGGDGQDTASGGMGDDMITGGIGNDLLGGDDGADLVDGGPGNDVVNGGNDNDTAYGGLGSDAVDGGAGDDLIIAGVLDKPGEIGSPFAGEIDSLHVLIGGPGNDVIHGDLGDDQIDAGEGNNTVFAYLGNDIVTAGSGNDFVDTSAHVTIANYSSRPDDDTITIAGGDNTVIGGRGSEIVITGAGIDLIDLRNLTNPTDTTATHTVNAGDGDNVVRTDQGPDSITTGGGNDLVFSYDGGDVIHLGSGSDTSTSGAGNDLINGELGNDVINGGGGDDVIDAGGGDDLVKAGAGHDIVYAQSGNDTASGEAGNDDIFLADGNDVAMGGAGDDLIVGGQGHDEIDGDGGNDLIWGGTQVFGRAEVNLADPSKFIAPPQFAAFDLLNPSGYTPPNIVPAITGGTTIPGVPDDGSDTARGGAGIDWIFGGGQSDVLSGGPDDDYIDGGAGPELIHGDSGDDQRGREVSLLNLQYFGEELIVPSGALPLAFQAVCGGMVLEEADGHPPHPR